MLHVWNIYLHLVDVYGKLVNVNVGKYTIYGAYGYIENKHNVHNVLCFFSGEIITHQPEPTSLRMNLLFAERASKTFP